MRFSISVCVTALLLTGCGSGGSNNSTDSGTNLDAGAGLDAGNTLDAGTGRATGTCTVTGATTGTANVYAICSDTRAGSGRAPFYAVVISTVRQSGSQGVDGTFPFGASAPTLGQAYGLSDAASGSTLYVPFVMYTSAANDIWMAGDPAKFDTTNGSISLTLSSCDASSHGTLTGTLKSTTAGDATLSCTF